MNPTLAKALGSIDRFLMPLGVQENSFYEISTYSLNFSETSEELERLGVAPYHADDFAN